MRSLRSTLVDSDGHRWMAPAVLLIVSIVGVVVFAPSLGSAISSSLSHDYGPAVAVPTPTSTSTLASPSTSTSTPTSSVPALPATVPASTPTSLPLVASEPPVPPATSTPIVAVPAVPQIAAVAVVALQTVPPIRDLIVRVGDVPMATDGLGQLAVAGLDATTRIEIVGRDAMPALQQVQFTGWADGSTATVRTMGELTGPVALIGLAVSSRVAVEVVELDGAAIGGARVEFVSGAGLVSLVAGELQWLVDSRAVPTADGLAVERVAYVPITVTSQNGSVRAAVQHALSATPEVLWRIVVGAA